MREAREALGTSHREQFRLIGWQEDGIEGIDGLLDLGAGDARIPLRHAQIPVPELTCDHVEFRAALAKPSSECMALMPPAA